MIPDGNDAPRRPRAGIVKTWPEWVAVAALWALTLAGQYWVFAVLFLAWGIYDVVSGESRFIQRVSRREHPATFWLVVVTWILMSALWLLYPG